MQSHLSAQNITKKNWSYKSILQAKIAFETFNLHEMRRKNPNEKMYTRVH